LIEPTPTQRDQLRKSFDKLLVEATIALPFAKVRSLQPSVKDELKVVIRDMLGTKDLTTLANRWEPQRKIDAALKETLRDDLIALLDASRPPYVGPVTVDLERARDDAQALRPYIMHSLPTAEAKKLLKRWNRRLTPTPTAREAIIGHLLSLLNSEGSASRVA
jgi:hypothetical protein